MSKIKSIVNATYKSKDTEEFLDIILYRPVGYVLALASRVVGLTPNGVTILSVFVGVAAGHLFYYSDLTLNIYGMLLLMLAEAMDSADGQLARMTNTKSRYGRILDGLGGNLWFISIYIHLGLRIIDGGGSLWIIVLMFAAGISHSVQSAMADYYRNFYVLFVIGKAKSEIDESKSLKNDYNNLSWKDNFVKKLLMWFYVNYTIEQEIFASKTRAIYYSSLKEYGDNFPAWLRSNYRTLNKPFVKYFNILTTNTRMIVLFIALFAGIPILYWLFELTLLNILLVYVVAKQNSNSDYLMRMIKEDNGD